MQEEKKTGNSVFKNKNYVLLFLGALVSNLGNTIYNFAISLYILDVTNNNALIAGLYLATGGLVYFIIAPFGGAIVDRLDRVKVVYITDFIRGVTIVVAGYLLFVGLTNNQQIIMLFICTIILAVNGAIFGPATSALPANILKPEQLQQSNSLMQGANSLYAIIGALLGATLFTLLGIKMIFIINGLSFILSGISEVFITTKTKADPDHVITFKSAVDDIKIGFKYLVKLKPIFYLILYASLLNFFMTPVFANGLPYLFKSQLQVSSIYYSFIVAAFPAGIIISSLILGIKKQKERIFSLLKMGLIGFALFMAIFTIGVHLHLANISTFLVFMITSVLVTLILGVYNGLINIPFGTAIQLKVEKDMQGRVFSVLSVIAMGLTPISMAIAGIIIEGLGVLTLFYISSIALVIITFLIIKNKYIRNN